MLEILTDQVTLDGAYLADLSDTVTAIAEQLASSVRPRIVDRRHHHQQRRPSLPHPRYHRPRRPIRRPETTAEHRITLSTPGKLRLRRRQNLHPPQRPGGAPMAPKPRETGRIIRPQSQNAPRHRRQGLQIERATVRPKMRQRQLMRLPHRIAQLPGQQPRPRHADGTAFRRRFQQQVKPVFGEPIVILPPQNHPAASRRPAKPRHLPCRPPHRQPMLQPIRLRQMPGGQRLHSPSSFTGLSVTNWTRRT